MMTLCTEIVFEERYIKDLMSTFENNFHIACFWPHIVLPSGMMKLIKRFITYFVHMTSHTTTRILSE